jgi:AraC-like DNA-binding protein
MAHRRRRVRLAYPSAYRELALILADAHGRDAAAAALKIPLSTFYRWNARKGELLAGNLQLEPRARNNRLRELAEACQLHGFDLDSELAKLEPALFENPHFKQPQRLRIPPTGDDEPARPKAHFRAANSLLSAPNVAMKSEERHALLSVRQEIERNFYSRLSCASLAHTAGLTRLGFIKAFKAAFGTSPYRYLTRVRIQRAKLLLATSRQPLRTIAAAVGFETQSCMCKAFRNIEGISLARYFDGVRLGAGIGTVSPGMPH